MPRLQFARPAADEAQLPSPEEQADAERYVLERELPRPKTDAKQAVKSTVLFFLLTFAAAYATFHLVPRFCCFVFLPASIQGIFQGGSVRYFLLFYLLSGIFVMKKAAIGVIRLYQHYAPEEIRRRCLFKPTCSEYAILAIQKHGLIIGLIQTYIRLFKRCRGNIYRIDYP